MHLLYLTLVAVFTTSLRQTSCSLVYEFTRLDWLFPNLTVMNDYIRSGDYVPEACQLSGLKVRDDGTIFVTVPRLRFKSGVPASLNTVHLKHPGQSNSKEGILKAYPDLESNKLGNCSNLQLAMSMEIDPRTGYLYVIDVGRVGFMSPTDPPSNLCPAKIVVLDTRNGGRIVRSHEFPDSVVSRTSNFLNDIVLDYVDPDHITDVRYAYISDTTDIIPETATIHYYNIIPEVNTTGSRLRYMVKKRALDIRRTAFDGKRQIVVFDFTTNTSWSVKDNISNSMKCRGGSSFNINGLHYQFSIGINGIALSPTFNYVYYSTICSKMLWQIPTWVLRNDNTIYTQNPRQVGEKRSYSDAMLFGHRGLYYGALEYDAIYRWEIEKELLEQRGAFEGNVRLTLETPLAQNWETMQWPDGLGFGNPDIQNLYYITARAQLFHNGKLDFSGGQGSNFRIGKIAVNDSSYLTTPQDQYYPHINIIG